MKKRLCALLALMLAAVLCAGAGAPALAAEERPAIYEGITDIAPDAEVMVIDGNPVPAEIYFYWLNYNYNSMQQDLIMYNVYYGVYDEMFDENNKILWDSELTDGLTIREYVEAQTKSALIFYFTVENMAAELGVDLTDEDIASLEGDYMAGVEQAGDEATFQDALYQMGLSRENFDRINGSLYLFERMRDLVLEEGSPLYLDPAKYDDYAVYADHILLSAIDPVTEEQYDEKKLTEQYATANQLLTMLRSTEDNVALMFNQLAETYGQDTGRAEHQGYVYTPGTMVEGFETAAAALEPGQISDIVQTDLGYHIIMRKDLQTGLKLDPEKKTDIAEEYLYELLQERIAKAEVVESDVLADFDSGAFFNDYNDILVQLNSENAN